MWFTQEAQPEIKRRVNVIRSFLNYLLYHDVCPEYKDQIAAAKSTCDVGEAQLWLVGECGRNMPGSFNIACSLLFHGWYYDCYMPSSNDEGSELAKRRIEEAQTAVRAALACHGSSEICKKYIEDTQSLKKQPLRKIRTGLEVTQIEFADDEKRQICAMPIFKGCKSTGKMTACTWWNPASLEPDLTEEEEAGGLTTQAQQSTYEFWVEEDILAKMFCGLKFEADVYELTFGVYFFDQPVNFRCSFFSWIPNEAMIGWRDHVYLPPRDPFPQPELEIIEG
jgi:Argonaute siRNA chaperone (ARC) complex subunit Arb1